MVGLATFWDFYFNIAPYFSMFDHIKCFQTLHHIQYNNQPKKYQKSYFMKQFTKRVPIISNIVVVLFKNPKFTLYCHKWPRITPRLLHISNLHLFSTFVLPQMAKNYNKAFVHIILILVNEDEQEFNNKPSYNPAKFINFLISSYKTKTAAAPVLLKIFDMAPR